MEWAGFPCTRDFFQQNPMRSGISAVHADHPVDERLDAACAWQLSVSRCAKNGQDVLEVPLPDGLALQALCAAAFLALTPAAGVPLWPLYAVLILSGAARAVAEPASQALLPFLVPAEQLSRAIAWSSSLWQLAVIAGPALGGVAYAFGAAGAYGFCCAAFLAAAIAAVTVSGRPTTPADTSTTGGRIARVAEGIRFVRSQPILLGSISLDLVAVLLGGATVLLPVFARAILHTGPIGLGLLRSAPAIGACGIALWQARHPPERSVGPKLLAAVAAFGLATVAFALSSSLILSLAALTAAGLWMRLFPELRRVEGLRQFRK
jgi:MFS family permease